MTKASLRLLLALALCAATAVVFGGASAKAAGGSQIPLTGTGSPITGEAPPSGANDATDEEFAGEADGEAGPDAYGGNIVDRSLSSGGVAAGVATTTGKQAKSNPQFVAGFEGLNLFQQRYARRGNQFTVEPPDQGMCAGNGYVVEAVNDVLNVYNTSGQSVLPDNTATNIVSGFPTDVGHARNALARVRSLERAEAFRSPNRCPWANRPTAEKPLGRSCGR